MNIGVNVYREEVDVFKYSLMLTPANNCFTHTMTVVFFFRGGYQQLQNNRQPKPYIGTLIRLPSECAYVCASAAVVSIMELQMAVYRL